MLTQVSFYIQGVSHNLITIPYVKELITDLIRNQISIVYLISDEDLCKMPKNKEILLITDSITGMKLASEKDIPCIVYARENSQSFNYKTAYFLIEGFEEIDSAYLNQIYHRAQNLPLLITTTARCLIRETIEEDIPFLSSLYQYPSVLQYTEPLEATKEGIEEALRCYASLQYRFYGFGLWTVTDLATDTVIGRCGLESRKIMNKDQIILSYMIAPSWQNKGLAAECAASILSYGFYNLHLQEIAAYIDASNKASIAVALRCGFHQENTIIYGTKPYLLYRIINPAKERKRLETARIKTMRHYKISSEDTVYKKRYS